MGGWFRWWRGSVADPKIGLVAARSGASRAETIAVWAWILESASEKDENGKFSTLDLEVVGACLGIDEDRVSSIVNEMGRKGLIVECRVANWVKRQPSREDASAERVRKHRERNALKRNVTQRNALKRNVTQCNAPESESESESEVVVVTPPKKPTVVIGEDVATTTAIGSGTGSKISGKLEQQVLKAIDRIGALSPEERDIVVTLIDKGCLPADFKAAYEHTIKREKPNKRLKYLADIIVEKRDMRIKGSDDEEDMRKYFADPDAALGTQPRGDAP